MMGLRSWLPLTLCVVLLCGCCAWYLPGVAPTEYNAGSPVALKVNKLSSSKTQLPYSYYYLPYCRPREGIQDSAENLGEILVGDTIENSPYKVAMKQNEQCKLLCVKDLKPKDQRKFADLIEDEYQVEWIVDNLPVAMKYATDSHGEDAYMLGFPVGLREAENTQKPGEKKFYLHNHVTLKLKYHVHVPPFRLATDGSTPTYTYRIVGAEVVPSTIEHQITKNGNDLTVACQGTSPKTLSLKDDAPAEDEAGSPLQIAFTYDVEWVESPVRWASRWDTFLKMRDPQIHWFSLVNSVMVVVFLSGMVAMILLRTLLRDIAKYNEMDSLEDAREESGWKLVHGDVFRKPPFFTLLAVSVGSGVQVLGMCLVTMLFAALGLLSPAHRGSLLQAMLLLFAVMGFLAGYVAVRIAKTFDNSGIIDSEGRLSSQSNQPATMTSQAAAAAQAVGQMVPLPPALTFGRVGAIVFLTSVLFPGVTFLIFFAVNMALWSQQSSGAIPFPTMLLLLVLWFGISFPLVYLGAFYANRKDAISIPVRTNSIPRQIPSQSWMSSSTVTCMLGGVLPFAAVFTEVFFIMTSIWHHQVYYFFGFLAIALLMLIVTCAEISIAFTYIQLAGEDYRWWWRSFISSAASGIYLFAYSIVYFSNTLRMTKGVSIMVYFAYMFIVSYSFFFLTGAVGFISAFIFTRSIYGSIKVD